MAEVVCAGLSKRVLGVFHYLGRLSGAFYWSEDAERFGGHALHIIINGGSFCLIPAVWRILLVHGIFQQIRIIMLSKFVGLVQHILRWYISVICILSNYLSTTIQNIGILRNMLDHLEPF